MNPEWFSPEKQSALLEQSEPLSTQWQTRGWEIQVLPLNLVHPNIFQVFILILETRHFRKDCLQPLNPNKPLYMSENLLWWQAFRTTSANTVIYNVRISLFPCYSYQDKDFEVVSRLLYANAWIKLKAWRTQMRVTYMAGSQGKGKQKFYASPIASYTVTWLHYLHQSLSVLP